MVIFVVMRWMLGIFDEHRVNRDRPSRMFEQTALPPEPRLQADPASDLARFQAATGSHIELAYGWIDPKARIVRIPIEQAMDLIAQRGLPKPPPDSIGKTPLQMRQGKGVSGSTSP